MKNSISHKLGFMSRLFAVMAIVIVTFSISISAPANALPVVHDVTFMENAHSADSTSTYQMGTGPAPLTLFAQLSPSFVNAGHSFTGWNTAPNGLGTSYADGQAFAFDAELTLYAQWTSMPPASSNLILNEGAAGIISMSGLVGSTTILPSLNNAVNVGHTFVNWNTKSDGSGIEFDGGSTFTFGADEILFAMWSADVYQISFSTGSGSDALPAMSFTVGSGSVVLPTATNPNGSFTGWFSASVGGSLIAVGGSTYTPTQSLVLFAHWNITSLSEISFNANGGSGSVAAIFGSVGQSVVMPEQLGLSRTGFQMTRWNTSANGSGTSYSIGQAMIITKSTVLYAQWSGHKPAALFGAIGVFKKNSASLSAVLKSQISRLALTVRSRKYQTVTLYGYSATTGLSSLNFSLSRTRARNVANFLRHRLTVLKVKHVTIRSAGEGAIAGESSSAFSRVEVFGV
jgi:hypothetical protein